MSESNHAPPPVSVRWFYATDAPKHDNSPFKVLSTPAALSASTPSDPPQSSTPAAQQPPQSVSSSSSSHQKNKNPLLWTAFSKRDSARIEEAFQLLALAAAAAKEAAASSDPIAIPASASTKVLVNEDFLYEVDVAKREVYPVYWYGPVYDIRRGTWFTSPDNTKFIPCDDNLAKQLEDGYKKHKPWKEFADSISTLSNVPSPVPSTSVLTHLSSTDSAPPTIDGSSSPKPTLTPPPPTSTSTKTELKWALFGPYMNSHVLYTEKRSAHIVNDNVSAKVARAFMSTVTRSAENPAAWGTKVVRGWDEVERLVRKGAVKEKPAGSAVGDAARKRMSVGNVEMATNVAVPTTDEVLGGSEGNLASKRSTERLVVEKEEEETGQDRQIQHLVLVIHGVGQKLGERIETVDFAKDCTTLRQTIKDSSKQYFTPGLNPTPSPSRDIPAGTSSTAGTPASTPTPQPVSSGKKPVISDMPPLGGVQVLPVQWRQKIEFGKRRDPHAKKGSLTAEEEEEIRAELEAAREKEVHLDEITLEGVQSIRYLVSDIVLDVLLYMTPKYRQQMVNHVIEEMNRIYNAYMLRNPDFKGKISLYGHSLGSLLAFDILCHQANGDLPLSPDARSGRSMSEMDLSDVIGQADKGERRLNGVMERTEIQYRTLDFTVDKFFAVGSPVGLFLLLKGQKLLGRPNATFPLQPHVAAPACNALYNIFHPHDPVAYRFEPLAAKALAREKPVPIAYNKGGLRGVVTGLGELSGGIVRSMFGGFFGGAAVAAVAGAAAVGSAPGSPAKKDEKMQTVGSSAEKRASDEKLKEKERKEKAGMSAADLKEKLKAQDLENVKLLNPRGRIDYVMQEGVLENPYLSSLSSHMAYWPDTDVAVFILRELYNNT
ncbi:DDHD domain-containing protein [Chytriomyces sp. MP71]|nr:DDHD domain-containing protein [Chytriomyces sp. MP71]